MQHRNGRFGWLSKNQGPSYLENPKRWKPRPCFLTSTGHSDAPAPYGSFMHRATIQHGGTGMGSGHYGTKRRVAHASQSVDRPPTPIWIEATHGRTAIEIDLGKVSHHNCPHTYNFGSSAGWSRTRFSGIIVQKLFQTTTLQSPPATVRLTFQAFRPIQLNKRQVPIFPVRSQIAT